MCQINSNKANNNSCNTELLRDIQQGTSKIPVLELIPI